MADAPLIVVVGSAPSSPVGASLATMRAELADQLGLYHPTLVTGPVAGDPCRYVISDDLGDDLAPWSEYLGSWLYVADGPMAGQQRRLVAEGYQGAAAAVTLGRPLGSPLGVNTSIEITSPLPVRRSMAAKGLNDCIDEALLRLPCPVRLALVGDGSSGYPLAAYPWVEQDLQLYGLYDTRGAACGAWGSPPTPSAVGARIEADGGLATLVTEAPFGAGEPFWAELVVPAAQVVSDGTPGAVWRVVPYGRGGLGDHDGWQTAAPARWVRVFAMVKALQAVRTLATAAPWLSADQRRLLLGDLGPRIRSWATAAKQLAAEFPKPRPAPRRAPVTGPVRASSWPG